MPKALVVDDEVDMALTVREVLLAMSLDVTMVHSAEDAMSYLNISDFDLLVLDWNLPGETGLSVCKFYRQKRGQGRILFLTGNHDISFKERGFNEGADDYLTKPFHAKELQLRVNALFQRSRELTGSELSYGDLTLDLSTRTLKVNGSRVPKINPRELGLLEFLMRNQQRHFNGRELLQQVWGADGDTSEESVRVSIKRLRTVLSEASSSVQIKNVHTYGYKLENEN